MNGERERDRKGKGGERKGRGGGWVAFEPEPLKDGDPVIDLCLRLHRGGDKQSRYS